jgi:3-oxoacyl-[acyl-carrier protein] reductase
MRSVVITGAGSGIGRACALRLAADGYRVTVNDVRDDAGEAVAAEIKAKGGTSIAAPGDVSSEADVADIVGASRAAFGDPTHLVNNAGIVQQALFVDLTAADFDRVFAVHVRSVFLMTKAVLPAMLASKSGVVVNMASQLGQIGGVELTHYSAAKLAIIGLTKSLAREVSALGVRVNAVAPGRSTLRSCVRCPKNGGRQKPRNCRSDGLASLRRSPPRSHFFARMRPAFSSARP